MKLENNKLDDKFFITKKIKQQEKKLEGDKIKPLTTEEDNHVEEKMKDRNLVTDETKHNEEKSEDYQLTTEDAKTKMNCEQCDFTSDNSDTAEIHTLSHEMLKFESLIFSI